MYLADADARATGGTQRSVGGLEQRFAQGLAWFAARDSESERGRAAFAACQHGNAALMKVVLTRLAYEHSGAVAGAAVGYGYLIRRARTEPSSCESRC